MEQELIKKLKKKDPKAQEYFYKTHSKAMFLICYRYLNNEEKASEVIKLKEPSPLSPSHRQSAHYYPSTPQKSC